jgi:hypothetical protein
MIWTLKSETFSINPKELPFVHGARQLTQSSTALGLDFGLQLHFCKKMLTLEFEGQLAR